MQTTNYGFNKPDKTEKYNVEQFNENFEIIDAELKAVANMAESGTKHPSNTNNPHNVTAAQVGLGNVPNVATNDQTPTYVVATENAALSSGEKLSVAFGKIAKAVLSLISHLADSVSHITATERNTWNSKANGTHTHTKSQITDFPTSMTPTAHTHTKSQITDFPTSMPASDVYSWAKASSKPSYTKAEVGLGNVDNTADSQKSVKYATSAGSADTASNVNGYKITSGTTDIGVGASLATNTLYVFYE